MAVKRDMILLLANARMKSFAFPRGSMYSLVRKSYKERAMSAIEVTSLSTKGQVVIPRSVRVDLKIKPGAKLLVMSDGQNVLLKPVEPLKLDTFRRLVAQGRSYARRAGLKRSDVPAAIRRVRHARRG
jgi:antitoxin PrlF